MSTCESQVVYAAYQWRTREYIALSLLCRVKSRTAETDGSRRFWRADKVTSATHSGSIQCNFALVSINSSHALLPPSVTQSIPCFRSSEPALPSICHELSVTEVQTNASQPICAIISVHTHPSNQIVKHREAFSILIHPPLRPKNITLIEEINKQEVWPTLIQASTPHSMFSQLSNSKSSGVRRRRI